MTQPQPEDDFIVRFGEPSGPEDGPVKHPPLRESKGFRAFTYGVITFAGLWIIATILAPDIKPSKLTFLGFLACLIYFAGEYISWERPTLPRRKPKQHHNPWRDR